MTHHRWPKQGNIISPQKTEHDERDDRFAASTLAATAWLIRFAPDRLAAWIARQPNGADLEKETRRLMAKKAARQTTYDARNYPL